MAELIYEVSPLEVCEEFISREDLGPGEEGHFAAAIVIPYGAVDFARVERVGNERWPAV